MQEQLDRIEAKLDFLIEMMLDEEEGSEQVVNTLDEPVSDYVIPQTL